MNILPKTSMGKKAGRCIIGFFTLLLLSILITYLQGPRVNETIFDNPMLSLTMITGFTIALGGALLGIISYWKYHERSIVIYGIIFMGFVLVRFLLGEMWLPH